jgi:hypothetical protein
VAGLEEWRHRRADAGCFTTSEHVNTDLSAGAYINTGAHTSSHGNAVAKRYSLSGTDSYVDTYQHAGGETN